MYALYIALRMYAATHNSLSLHNVTDFFGMNQIMWTLQVYIALVQLTHMLSIQASPFTFSPKNTKHTSYKLASTFQPNTLTGSACIQDLHVCTIKLSCDNDICPTPLWVLLPHDLLLARTEATHDNLLASTLTWNAASEGSLVSLLRPVARGQSCSAKRSFKFKTQQRTG